MIVGTALQSSNSSQDVVVIGTDTDLLVIVVARSPPESAIYPINPGLSKAPQNVCDVSAIQKGIGQLKDNKLFLHAITGSDTTSAP